MKRALITGITGQDGSYLASFCSPKDTRCTESSVARAPLTPAASTTSMSIPMTPGPALSHYGDLANAEQLTHLIYNMKPDEIYHLGAQSHVKVSFEMPEYTGDITGLGTTRILEAIRRSGLKSKFYQASSSEMFGNAPAPQNEHTPFQPRSPYAAAKVYAYWMAVNYREGYRVFRLQWRAVQPREPRRGETFVTRKITRAIARIVAGQEHKLYLGNLEAQRDWGYAPEYVEAMWLMLQQDEPEDYVIGTGEAHSVRDFVEAAFGYAGLDWQAHVEVDQRYFRPTEVDFLRADASKARRTWDGSPGSAFRNSWRLWWTPIWRPLA